MLRKENGLEMKWRLKMLVFYLLFLLFDFLNLQPPIQALAAVTVSLSDKKLLFGIISTITAMLQSIQEDLIGQIPSLTLLFKYFTPEQVFSTLQGILTVFEFHPKLMSTTFSLLNILIGLWKGSEQYQIDMKNISSAFSFDYFVHCLNVNLPEGEIGKVIIDQEWVKNLVNCVIALRYEVRPRLHTLKTIHVCVGTNTYFFGEMLIRLHRRQTNFRSISAYDRKDLSSNYCWHLSSRSK